MSLHSTNISKVKRLSLKEVRLPAPLPPPEPLIKDLPPTPEEIAYSKLLAKCPQIEELVNRLDLVSSVTGQRIKIIDLSKVTPPEEPRDIKKLFALAEGLLQPQNNYSQDEVVDAIKHNTKVTKERAEIGFNLILRAGAILKTITGERYYLSNSSPF
jgi:hypothetical protein